MTQDEAEVEEEKVGEAEVKEEEVGVVKEE